LKTLIVAVLLAAAIPVCAQEQQPKHYCNDQEAWAEWKDLVNQYPSDDQLAAGYALRLGLCAQIKAGEIETDRAIKIFDDFMNALKWEAKMKTKRTQDEKQERGI
jgi:hypothetical protein